MDWSRYPNFKESEFACSHCGRTSMDPDFMFRLQLLRARYNKPMSISSGYRCPQHPIEVKKASSGAHTTGKAADVAVHGADAHRLLTIAMDMNFKGIGVQQKGSGRFIHLDDWENSTRPTVWSY